MLVIYKAKSVQKLTSILAHILAFWTIAIAPAQAANELGFDPVTEDPTVVDRQFPPSSVEVVIHSGEDDMHGLLYLAQGKGPHPSLIFLHGFPGYEQNLDLAQSLRRSGFNILTFHYRGSWGSEGTFSILNARDDVAKAADFLRDPQNPSAERIDAARLGVVGHALGGFLALEAAAIDQRFGCIVALTPANMGVMAEAARTDPAYRAELEKDTGKIGPINGVSGEVLVEELLSHPELNAISLATQLAPRPLLLVGASSDTVLPNALFHTPLTVAYQSLEWPQLRVILMDGDHFFSWNRLAMTRKVTDWAAANCKNAME
jgi:hypothetical protein